MQRLAGFMQRRLPRLPALLVQRHLAGQKRVQAPTGRRSCLLDFRGRGRQQGVMPLLP